MLTLVSLTSKFSLETVLLEHFDYSKNEHQRTIILQENLQDTKLEWDLSVTINPKELEYSALRRTLLVMRVDCIILPRLSLEHPLLPLELIQDLALMGEEIIIGVNPAELKFTWESFKAIYPRDCRILEGLL